MEPKNYNVEEVAGGVPVKMWTRGVPIEDEAKRQLANAARLPIVFKHIAAMPDVHLGIGATVGSVIPTVKAIIPAAVGVDIGCGMIACKTTLRAEDLPDNLGPLRSAIERAGLSLVVNCEQLTDDVFVARDMWEKIVLNLLSNAFKFTFAFVGNPTFVPAIVIDPALPVPTPLASILPLMLAVAAARIDMELPFPLAPSGAIVTANGL